MKFRVFERGTDGKKLGTVEVPEGGGYETRTTAEKLAAEKLAAERFGYERNAIRLEVIEERADTTCQQCGHPFKMPKKDIESGHMRVCTLCRSESDMQHKARIFLKAKDKYEALLKKRATATGKSVDAIRKLVEKR